MSIAVAFEDLGGRTSLTKENEGECISLTISASLPCRAYPRTDPSCAISGYHPLGMIHSTLALAVGGSKLPEASTLTPLSGMTRVLCP
jgi:hypothetical protein